jgi:hypothetical protein
MGTPYIRTAVKVFRTYTRNYSLLKSECSITNIKLTLYEALIRSVMTYAVPPGSMPRMLTS